MANILIDLSHNEQFNSFPEHIFPPSSFLFNFNTLSNDLEDFESLAKYNLIILGNPRPKSRNKYLFSPEELKSLKKYVANGGNLFITSSAHGDYDFDHSSGSLRVFYRLTGIQKYYNAVLYSPNTDHFHLKKTNLLIRNFPKHPLFHDFGTEDYLIFGRATFFILHPEIKPELIVQSCPEIYFHDFFTQKKMPINPVPIITAHQYLRGKVITTASSSFLTNDSINGIHGGSNKKFLLNCLNWFFSKDDD